MILQIFALKKVLFLPFFYSIDVCGNGYLENIVTTCLFMTLVLLEIIRICTFSILYIKLIFKGAKLGSASAPKGLRLKPQK